MSQPSLLPPLYRVPPERRLPLPVPTASRRRRARSGLLALVVIATLVLVLATSAAAPAAGGSKHLSTQGWRTYRAYELLGNDIDILHPSKAHAQLRRLMPHCSRLPGRGTQSTGVRTICKHGVGVADRFVVAQLCGKGGGGQTAIGLCLISALPAIDRDFDGGARAGGTVAATLAPGRCRRAFAGLQLNWSTAATSGRAFLDAMASNDLAAVESAGNRWEKALSQAFDTPIGQGDAGCRPGR